MTEEQKKSDNKGENQIISPHPLRQKFVTELLHAFGQRKISFAQMTRLEQKKIKQVSEMGFVKLRNGRYEEAREIFQTLAFIDHKNFFHHLSLGSAHQKLKRYADALFCYGQALQYDPGNLNTLVNRGEVYLRLKSFRKAAEDFREAILADKSGKDRFANRARSLVIAIKRSLVKDKELKEKIAKGEIAPSKKKISPLLLITPKAPTLPSPKLVKKNR